MIRFTSPCFARSLALLVVAAGLGGCPRASKTTQAPANEGDHAEVSTPAAETPEAGSPSGDGAVSGGEYLYTATERQKLHVCVGLGEAVWIATNHHSQGRPKELLLAHYSGDGLSELVRQLIERVYAEPIGAPFDRTVAFYGECVLVSGKVPQERSGLAVFCLIHTLITRITFERKAAGATFEQVVAALQGLPESVVPVISAAYHSTLPRIASMTRAWDECMDPLAPPEPAT